MKIAVLTSLYPSRVRPHEGIFAERRWAGMVRRGHAVRVTHPLPRAPFAVLGPLVGRPHWLEIGRMPALETREGILIRRPRYGHVPGRSLANARGFARAGVESLLYAGAPDRPDVVVLDYAWPAALAVGALRAARLPVVVSGRGSDVLLVAESEELARELGEALRSAGHWCGVSRDLVQAMDRLAGRPGQGRLVPNGVDLELFRPGDRAAARARLGRGAAGSLVLVVGHLIPRKDPLLALEAFARVAPDEATLVFVGSGPLEAEVARRARAAGLAARVAIVGAATPEILREWYAACDVLLLASSREGRPNVVLEALACGRPVVATDAGGTSELFEDVAGALPEGALPEGALPEGALPEGALPEGALPEGALPGGSLPGGGPGALVMSRDPARLGAALAAVLASPPTPERCRAQVASLTWDASLDALEALLLAARAGEARS